MFDRNSVSKHQLTRIIEQIQNAEGFLPTAPSSSYYQRYMISFADSLNNDGLLNHIYAEEADGNSLYLDKANQIRTVHKGTIMIEHSKILNHRAKLQRKCTYKRLAY